MASQEAEDNPAATPLDAERERLRKAGYTDTEISQILIARETARHSSESAGHGVMTGVASNLAAAAGYVRNFIPGIVADTKTLGNSTATAMTRSQAAGYLVLKAAVVIVIAYVVWQEFSQLQSMTARATAEACIARQKLLVDTMPMNESSSQYKQWQSHYAEFHHDCAGE